MEVRIQRLEPMTVAARRHDGPYEGLADTVNEIVRWLKAQKTATGAVTAVFEDTEGLEAGDPIAGDGQEPIRAEVWIPWHGEDLPEDAPGLTLKEASAPTAACVKHTGHPLAIPRFALALRAFLENEGRQPEPETRVVHLMPDWEEPENWVAEVQVPLLQEP